MNIAYLKLISTNCTAYHGFKHENLEIQGFFSLNSIFCDNKLPDNTEIRHDRLILSLLPKSKRDRLFVFLSDLLSMQLTFKVQTYYVFIVVFRKQIFKISKFNKSKQMYVSKITLSFNL